MSNDPIEDVYDYKGVTVVLSSYNNNEWFATVITGTVANPHDREVGPTMFATKEVAKKAAEKMIDDEIEAEIEWERSNGIYIEGDEK